MEHGRVAGVSTCGEHCASFTAPENEGAYVHGGSAVEPIAGSQLRAERRGRAWLFPGTPLPSPALPTFLASLSKAPGPYHLLSSKPHLQFN